MSAKTAKPAAKKGIEIKAVGKTLDVNVADTGRRAWLASLGAVALAQDEIVRMANRAVERGEIAQKAGQKRLDKAMAMPQKGLKNARHEVEGQVDAVMDWLGVVTRADLENMNLPTRSDIEQLTEKVAALTRKVEQLRKAEEQQAEPVEQLTQKVGTLTRKVNELRKAEEQQEEPVEQLTQKVGALTRKVNELRKAEEQKAEPVEPAKK